MKKAIFASERTFRDGWKIGTPAVWGHLCELTETPYLQKYTSDKVQIVSSELLEPPNVGLHLLQLGIKTGLQVSQLLVQVIHCYRLYW